ncbi:MAG: radical SAM/SPASM domain-containing protein [Candidatus Scalinduaceae bacterium]
MTQAAQKDHIHHDLAGENILHSDDARFIEYRKRWDENPKKLDHGDFPLHLDIEVTSACNLKCPFCATTYSRFKDGFMSWKTAKRILDEAGEKGLYACKFNFRGEPLLHKELGRFISYAKEKGIIDVFFNTNAVLLTEEKAKMLIDAGVDRITISFEGFEKSLYEKNRVGAKFEEVVANVERLRSLRERHGVSKPKIRVQTVLVPELKNRMDEFIAFWEDRVDQVSYNDMEPSVDTVKKKIKSIKSSWICPFPYQRMTVMWDGTITACKNDYFGKLAFGNVKDLSIKETWNSGLERLRRLHQEGRAHEIEACGECPLRISELIKRKEVEVN